MKRFMPYVIGGAVAIMIFAAWFLIFYQGTASDLKKENQRVADQRSRQQDLNTKLKRRQDMQSRELQTRSDLAMMKRFVPDTPDLAEFIWTNYDTARQAGVTWTSLQPALPKANTKGGLQADIELQIQIEGSYYQVIDYLRRIENLQRSVVVDEIDISVDQKSGILAVGLRARMFSTKGNLPWTPSDADMVILGQPGGASQIPAPPPSGCTAEAPGFSYGQEPNNKGNCSGSADLKPGTAPAATPAGGTGGSGGFSGQTATPTPTKQPSSVGP